MKNCIIKMSFFTMITYVVNLIYYCTFPLWDRLSWGFSKCGNTFWWAINIFVLLVPFLVYNLLVPLFYKDFKRHKLCSIATVVVIAIIMFFVNCKIISTGFVNDDFEGLFFSIVFCWGNLILNQVSIIISCIWNTILERKTKNRETKQ